MSREKNLVLLVVLCLLFSATGANGGWITPAAVVDFLVINPYVEKTVLSDGGEQYSVEKFPVFYSQETQSKLPIPGEGIRRVVFKDFSPLGYSDGDLLILTFETIRGREISAQEGLNMNVNCFRFLSKFAQYDLMVLRGEELVDIRNLSERQKVMLREVWDINLQEAGVVLLQERKIWEILQERWEMNDHIGLPPPPPGIQ